MFQPVLNPLKISKTLADDLFTDVQDFTGNGSSH
jgi:hypothetical protein